MIAIKFSERDITITIQAQINSPFPNISNKLFVSIVPVKGNIGHTCHRSNTHVFEYLNCHDAEPGLAGPDNALVPCVFVLNIGSLDQHSAGLLGPKIDTKISAQKAPSATKDNERSSPATDDLCSFDPITLRLSPPSSTRTLKIILRMSGIY